MRIVFFGLSISSAWGNGHATAFRALIKALHQRGHRSVFYERNVEWYASNRDMPDPPFCDLRLFDNWEAALPAVRGELRDADVAVVGSYFPNGIQAAEELLNSAVPVKAFYDIDTPITVSRLRNEGATEYLRVEDIPAYDVYFSFTGGPMLREIEDRFGAPLAVPLYCAFDSGEYRRFKSNKRFCCDLSYMGTYASDRQPKIEEFLMQPARAMPGARFIVAGPQYPKGLEWPSNIRRITHLNPRWHSRFYSSSRFTLNVTRREMVMAGYSPSVRLFEAAASGATIISDNWPGLNTFFVPQQEILLPGASNDIVHYLRDLTESEIRRIGDAAQQRVLERHTSMHRAKEFEAAIERALTLPRRPGAFEQPVFS